MPELPRRQALSRDDIDEVFCLLGLSSELERQRFSDLANPGEECTQPEDTCYVIRFSHQSDIADAELE